VKVAMLEVIQIQENKTIRKCVLITALLIIFASLNAQTDKKFIRKGNREYDKSKYSDSEISYRKAIDKNKQSPDAVFNVGDALYKQDKFEEAGKQFIESTNESDDRIKKSDGLYNLGNSLLKANKLQESIEAYKNSLKLHPDNREAKYNLAYAQDLLKLQQEKQKKQQQDKDKQDQNKDKKKEDQKKDQKEKNKDQQKDQKDNQDQKQQQQPGKQEISKEDAQRLLNSLANDEKNVQEKVKLAKATKTKVRTVKNW
jgi:Ca-activated chloride channel family protein